MKTPVVREEVAFEAGRRGETVRGDCWVGFRPREAGGLEIRLQSRLEALYGDSIRDLLGGILERAGIRHGVLDCEDQGAYPFVLRARMESLLGKVLGQADFRVEPQEPAGPLPPIERARRRRSRLYLPGNEPRYMVHAALHRPDGVILDLEDSVAPEAKADARALVRHALFAVDWGGCERMVRINPGELGRADLQALRGAPLHLVLLPKVETAEEVRAREAEAAGEEWLFLPILETARGILNAREIAQASRRNVGLTLGLEDLTADLGVRKTAEGRETLWARSQVVFAAVAAGLQPIDSVFGDVSDEEGLRRSVREAKALGFVGKGCVHPRQIRVVHEEFAPFPAEIERACRIVRAFEEARAQGLSVVRLGTRMIDPPVVKRAGRTVADALEAGLLEPGWETKQR